MIKVLDKRTNAIKYSDLDFGEWFTVDDIPVTSVMIKTLSSEGYPDDLMPTNAYEISEQGVIEHYVDSNTLVTPVDVDLIVYSKGVMND